MVISNKPKPWIIVIICFLLENGSLMDALLMYHKKQGWAAAAGAGRA